MFFFNEVCLLVPLIKHSQNPQKVLVDVPVDRNNKEQRGKI